MAPTIGCAATRVMAAASTSTVVVPASAVDRSHAGYAVVDEHHDVVGRADQLRRPAHPDRRSDPRARRSARGYQCWAIAPYSTFAGPGTPRRDRRQAGSARVFTAVSNGRPVRCRSASVRIGGCSCTT